jgi:vancomycin permeability regulator SanA
MNSILLILLGCNITSLLMDRVMTAINFIEENQHNFNKITWYLSGGIKFEGHLSEASIMKKELEQVIQLRNLDKHIHYDYILDEKSKNTAENFYRSSVYLNTSQEIYDDVYIITSKFHHDRARLMMSYVDSSRSYNWLLGDMQQTDSLYWESIHIQNVVKDVEKLSSIEL